MMGPSPELGPPPELKSSPDPSKLVVRQLTGEHCADNAGEVDLSSLERAEAENRASGEHARLGSLRASRAR